MKSSFRRLRIRSKINLNLPTGTVTFLFTDIEGSTRLWQQHPETMPSALASHHAILNETIAAHSGYVFQIIGDAFCAAFSTARDGLDAALAAQRALRDATWGETGTIHVRMALHSGAAEVRAGEFTSGEYVSGLTLSRVARLLSAGHGGQTLISMATQELVRDELPQNMTLRDMGEQRLKDLIRPEHIYQLLVPDLPDEFPPLKTMETFRNNLPSQLSSFVGREKEMAEVKRLITRNRLTTLTGTGGTGKTRLSLQVATDLLDSFPDGVWFIEFAPLTDAALVLQTVRTTLGLREEMGRSKLVILTDYLQAKKVLLIFDNCEHIVEALANCAEALLQDCPNLRILASSREALGISGEKVYRVPSLSIPDSYLATSVAIVSQCEAARLFIDRAQTALPTFVITNDNAHVIAQVCSRLDGIPLAIELGAARVKMLTVEQIADRLDDRFRLLTNGNRTALPRQRTLRAMIDWSFDLLSEPERALLRRLSVFAGGWTLEAAETVCQGHGEGSDVLDSLTQLVNKSLVVVYGHEGKETRYRLLETIRLYALEKLSEVGKEEYFRDRHLEYFFDLAERAEQELTGPQMPEWLKRLEGELDNLHAALEWSMKRDELVGLRLACALLWFWDGGGYLRDGYNWLVQLLRLPETQSIPIVRARAFGIQGYLLVWSGSAQEAHPILVQSLALCRDLGDRQGVAFSLLLLGLATSNNGDPAQGRRLVAESLALYRELGDKFGTAWALTYLGGCVGTKASPVELARAYLEEGLAIWREMEFLAGKVHILVHLGQLALDQRDYRAARPWLEESLALQRQLGKGGSTVLILANLGDLVFQIGDYKLARTYYEESLSVSEETGNLIFASWVPVSLGYVALRQKDKSSARKIFEETQQRFREEGDEIGVVYALEGLASLAVVQDRPERAARVFSWADGMRETIGEPRSPVQQADVDRDLATIHAQLDEKAWAAAYTAGRTLTLEQAVAYALEEPPFETPNSATR